MKGGSDEKNAVYAVRSLPAFALCRLRTAAPDDIQQVPVSPLPEKMAMARACESTLWESQYNEYSAGNATYSYMTNTSTLNICNSFSQAACAVYDNCSSGFNFKSYAEFPAKEMPSVQVRNASKPYTREQLKRNQRAVAGLLYAYLVKTGRNW